MLEFIGGIVVFFVLFVFSGLAAVFFTRQYLSVSWMQLLLGYLGGVGVATGISTSLLGFSAVFSVMLALGVSAALIGFGAGVHWLGLLENSSEPVPEKDEEGREVENESAGYSDEEVARRIRVEE